MLKFHKLFSADFFASFVVFLVALPLSLGIAVASGAPPQAGLIAAAVGGIVIGILGGAPLQVSGPAAGLTVMVFNLIQKLGLLKAGLAITFSGLFQVLVGSLGLASLALMISPSLIQAMLAGIGALIVLAQLNVLFGFTPSGSGLQNLKMLFGRLPQLHFVPTVLGLLSLFLITLWEKLPKSIKQRMKLLWLPPPLLSVIMITSLSSALGFSEEILPRIKVSNSFLPEQFWIQSLQFNLELLKETFIPGLAIAFVASAESLLCAVATDQLHNKPRARLNKELIAQGLGNFLSGILGGLPVTGVIVRSTANVNAGAQTRISAILHGVWIFIFASFFSIWLNKIPFTVLAAVLISVGLKLIKIYEFRKSRQYGEAWVYIITFAGVVGINLLWGIGLGLLVTLYLHLKEQTVPNLKIIPGTEKIPTRVKLLGDLNVFSVPALMKQLNKIPAETVVEIDAEIEKIDYSVIHALNGWKQSHISQGGSVIHPNFNDIFYSSKNKLPKTN